jgi:myotubularin-related protein 6/7/8
VRHAEDHNLQVPYPLISLVQRLPQTLHGQCPITFHLRNFESLTFTFEQESSAADVFESVKELTVASGPHSRRLLLPLFNDVFLIPRIVSVTQLYAFYYRPNPPLPSNNGWSIYSLDEELERMGVGTRSKTWRVTNINEDYSVCTLFSSKRMVSFIR